MDTWQSGVLLSDRDSVADGTTLDQTIEDCAKWLLEQQASDGHWVFELEADATIPSDFVIFNHFIGDPDPALEQKIAAYLRRTQGTHGGWPLHYDGDIDLSCTVKAYFALKLTGDDTEAPHMRRAREVILSMGGAARASVFTRIMLALFAQVPWRAVPVMRAEAMFLPKWAPFHIDKVSYWSRTVMVPLFVVAALKPVARNPLGVHVQELFTIPPEEQENYLTNPKGNLTGEFLLLFDSFARVTEKVLPRPIMRNAIEQAMAFIRERANGEDGLGGIFPAMMFYAMALDCLGCDHSDPEFLTVRRSMKKLVVERETEAYIQPCVSPVWDTGLALHALLESELGDVQGNAPFASACNWLCERQILDVVGDWKANRPRVRPGGWAFQYRNDYYPDVDDTAVVAMALHRIDREKYREAIDRSAEWILGMQSRSGGWGAFDADNEHYFLENIPFADHGALLDPPTSDVTARCLGLLAQLGYPRSHPAIVRGIGFLKREQEEDGSWFGRWGTNYVYGTWSVLSALNAVGEDLNAPYIRRAVDWIMARQRADGGWGEDCTSYWPERRREVKTSTPSQTAWALLALMAAGEVESTSVNRGVGYLLNAPRDGGKWEETFYNAVGFPKVFYLLYHGYSAYFPLWALARYRALSQSNTKRPLHGL